MHKTHDYNFQIALHLYIHVTFLKILSLPRGAEKLGAGALAKLCQEEKQTANSALLAISHKCSNEKKPTEF